MGNFCNLIHSESGFQFGDFVTRKGSGTRCTHVSLWGSTLSKSDISMWHIEISDLECVLLYFSSQQIDTTLIIQNGRFIRQIYLIAPWTNPTWPIYKGIFIFNLDFGHRLHVQARTFGLIFLSGIAIYSLRIQTLQIVSTIDSQVKQYSRFGNQI